MTTKSRSIWTILALVLFLGTTGAFAQSLLDPSTLTKYIDPLPQPPVRTPNRRAQWTPAVRRPRQSGEAEDAQPARFHDARLHV